MATQKTIAVKSKQPKKKRSLRKNRGTPVSEQKGLAIDLDKNQLDAIFADMYLGRLQNPQMALAMVYSLALDALEKTLVQGIDEAVQSVTSTGILSDNPFADMIRGFLAQDPAKLSTFRLSIADKIKAAKENILKSVRSMHETDAHGGNLIQKKLQFSQEAVREFIQQVENCDAIPNEGARLSDERLRDLYDAIQKPLPDDGIKRFKIDHLPEHYRFSFGEKPAGVKHTDTVHVSSGELKNEEQSSSDETESDVIEQDEIAKQDASVSEASDVEVIATANRASDSSNIAVQMPNGVSLDSLGMTSEQIEQFKSGTVDAMQMAVDVAQAMKGMAVQIAQATMAAFDEDQFLPSLSAALQNDPRMKEDEELAAFVEQLEYEDGSDEESNDETIDNDELAAAFGKLLDGFDF